MLVIESNLVLYTYIPERNAVAVIILNEVC